MSQPTPARIVSVGGGKGGVGKSVVAANLAVELARRGQRVVLVDADLGQANQHTLFGIDRPGVTLQGFVDHQVESLEEARIPTGVSGLSLVPGCNGVVGAANPNHGQKGRLLRHIRRLDADVVVVDVGAGVSFNVLDLFDVAELRLVVVSPQLTAVQNAYGFVKGALWRSLRQAARTPEEHALLDAGASELSRVGAVLEHVARASPELALRLRAQVQGFGCALVGNQLFEPREAGVVASVSQMLKDFLCVKAPVLGCLRASRTVHESVNKRRPFALEPAAGEPLRSLQEVADGAQAALFAAPAPRLEPLADAA